MFVDGLNEDSSYIGRMEFNLNPIKNWIQNKDKKRTIWPNKKTMYKYDIHNNLIEKDMDDSYDEWKKTTYKYDSENNMIEKYERCSNGECIKDKYNSKNKMIKKTAIIRELDN